MNTELHGGAWVRLQLLSESYDNDTSPVDGNVNWAGRDMEGLPDEELLALWVEFIFTQGEKHES